MDEYEAFIENLKKNAQSQYNDIFHKDNPVDIPNMGELLLADCIPILIGVLSESPFF